VESKQPHKVTLLFEGDVGQQSWPLVVQSKEAKEALLASMSRQWQAVYKLELMIVNK